jgi:propionyl-CoA carboxylase beta chain
MHTVINAVSDRNDFYEMMPSYARNMITGFSEVEGRVVGIVAN